MEEDKSLHELKEETIEDMATAIENDEVAIPLEANGKEEEEEEEEENTPDLGDLEYADGKVRDELDLIEEEEKIYGTDLLSPFKTADIRVLKRKLETMSMEKMQDIADKVAARHYSSSEDQKQEIIDAFRNWSSTNGSFQTDATIKAEKGARSDAFEDAESVNKLEEKLKSKTLSDLQATAARLGFNPGFDREKLITVIKQEYRRQS